MKTVLIVEDEKMIRQGIRTMVQRSGVPVEVIMECSNGLAALEMLKEQEVEVMFTDIRMPKMDGIELVREIQKLDRKPEIVAISGFDDFSYAVEMLRNGVREYILKPVERQKITEIMQKLDEEIKHRNKREQNEVKIGKQQLKHFLVADEVNDEEMELLTSTYESSFFESGYVVCVAGKDFKSVENIDDMIYYDDFPEGNVAVVGLGSLSKLLSGDLISEYAGVSQTYYNITELRKAYCEAVNYRKYAFINKLAIVNENTEKVRVPEGLLKQTKKLTDEQTWMQRLHLVGTDKTDDLASIWEVLFGEVKKNHVIVEDFEEGIKNFLVELPKIYKNLIGDEEKEKIEKLSNIFAFNGIDVYEESFMGLIMDIHYRANSEEDSSKNQQKIKLAMEYIRENYNKDLNMAVVSNYISMNYSLFSFEFKRYTGSNFVGYLKELRMKEAKRLLSETDMHVNEISLEVGYENEKHFMKTFKATCGVSPSEYRKNMQRG